MIPIIICVILAIIIPILRVRHVKKHHNDYWGKPNYPDIFASWLLGSAFVLGALYMMTQLVFGMFNITSQNVTYSQQLVSLKDGTGIEGQSYGSLFVSRGYIEDTQVFSYYRVAAPGQYALDKRNAQQSTIWTDATPETARVDVTDTVYGCNTTWYSTWCLKQPNVFVHADFHVPAGTIQQKFELDAQ